MKRIDARTLNRMLSGGRPVAVIDVLPEADHRRKHVPGSVSIPLERPSFLQRVGHLTDGPDDPVVVYCADADCNASSEAARTLEEAGFRFVYEFGGGIDEWESAGFPVEGEAVEGEVERED